MVPEGGDGAAEQRRDVEAVQNVDAGASGAETKEEQVNLYAFKVKLHMKSGAVLEGYVTRLKKNFNGNDLTGLEWEGTMPFYFRLNDISAVEAKQVLNWRRLFR